MAQDGHNPDKQTIFAAMMAEDVCREHRIKPHCLLADMVDRRVGQQVKRSLADFGYISSMELMGLYISQV